jgi:hypothetical protein
MATCKLTNEVLQLAVLVVPEQFPGLNMKPFGDPPNVVDRDVSFRSLNTAEVGAVDAAVMRQGFLREPALGAEPPHVLSEGIAKLSFVRPFHRRD